MHVERVSPKRIKVCWDSPEEEEAYKAKLLKQRKNPLVWLLGGIVTTIGGCVGATIITAIPMGACELRELCQQIPFDILSLICSFLMCLVCVGVLVAYAASCFAIPVLTITGCAIAANTIFLHPFGIINPVWGDTKDNILYETELGAWCEVSYWKTRKLKKEFLKEEKRRAEQENQASLTNE